MIERPEDIRLNEFPEDQHWLGPPPGWLLRWGVTFVFFLVALLIALGFWIRYPDVVEANARLTTGRPPVGVVAPVSGRVTQWWVEEGDSVRAGEILAWMENPASHRDVLLLDSLVKNWAPGLESEILPPAFTPPANLDLGEVQAAYAAFCQVMEELRYRLSQDATQARIDALRNQIDKIRDLGPILERQVATLSEIVFRADSIQKKYEPQVATRIITPLEYEEARTKYLRARQELESKEAERINNLRLIAQLEEQILALLQTRDEQTQQSWNLTRENFKNLRGQLAAWKQRYLVTTPVDGKTAFSGAHSQGQAFEAGQEMFTVVPGGGNPEIIAVAHLLDAGLGKLETGMTVRLRLEGYPYRQYGELTGQLNSLPQIPDQHEGAVQVYQAIITLDSLRTTHGTEITFRQDISARARIITHPRSLLGRIVDWLKLGAGG